MMERQASAIRRSRAPRGPSLSGVLSLLASFFLFAAVVWVSLDDQALGAQTGIFVSTPHAAAAKTPA